MHLAANNGRNAVSTVELDQELKAFISGCGSDRLGQSYGAAFLILRYYLGAAWAEKYLKLRHDHDPFMLNEFDEASENRYTHMHRVLALGDAVYGLQIADGFSNILDRLARRSIRPCYFETTTAADFLDDGFAVSVVPEVNQRGFDFDFSITRDGQSIAVEVTAKNEGIINIDSLYNTLHSKRTQLPKDRPAILFVVIPEEWTQDGAVAEVAIGGAINRFWQTGSRRINVIVLKWTATLNLGEGRLKAEVIRPYFNPNPYHQLSNVEFLQPPADLNGLREAAANREEELTRSLEDDPKMIMPRFWQAFTQ